MPLAPQIPRINSEQRLDIGKEYKTRIENVISDRNTLLQDTWRRAARNYEGKAKRKTWPWKDASNAFLPITATHTDSLKERQLKAVTAADPVHLIREAAKGELIPPGINGEPGLTIEEFARILGDFSKEIERQEVPIKDIMDEVIGVYTQLGDSIAYVHWGSLDKTFYDLVEGEWVKNDPLDVLNKPVVDVLSPDHFYIPTHENKPDAIQTSKWVGYDFTLDASELRLRVANGEYSKGEGNQLLEWMSGKRKKGKETSKDYFQPTSDGRLLSDNDLAKEREAAVGLDSGSDQQTLDMVHVWARIDLDGDGIEEEVNFHLHYDSGLVPYISYNPYQHRKRPFVPFHYIRRNGIFYSIGVPELLFNIQKIMNEVMRDILNNNKIQNTKAFLARRGGAIKRNEKIHPGRVLFVDSIKNDFAAVDMGSGRAITSVQDLLIMQEWGERRTGITDTNLGREKHSRTPATSVLALLEQSTQRIDGIIERMKTSMEEMWTMVLQLFAQNGAGGMEFIIEGVVDGARLVEAWRSMAPESIRRMLKIKAQASSDNLNRSLQRQENMALFGQLEAYYQKLLQVVQLMGMNQDPALREVLMAFLNAGRRINAKILDSYDIKDQDILNPDLEEYARNVKPNIQVPPAQGAGGTGERSSQVQQATNLLGAEGPAAGPANVTGRPEPGLPRAQ